MSTVFLFALAIFALVAVIELLKPDHKIAKAKRSEASEAGEPEARYKAKALLSPAERSFFGVLDSIVPKEIQIFAKVRLADVITPERFSRAAFNKISAKHLDFVLCDNRSLRVLGAIELDDKSHDSDERRMRDCIVDNALSQAEIPIVRIKARESYVPDNVREALVHCNIECYRGGSGKVHSL